MSRDLDRALGAVAMAVLLVGCGNGSTGSGLVDFEAFGAGPNGAERPLRFTTERGYEVELVEARLVVGGVYVNRNVPLQGAQEQPCVLPGLYVAEVTSGLEVDLLDGEPQLFAERGSGLVERGFTGEVWLKSDNVAINDPVDSSPVAWVEGTATRGDQLWPFEARVTIGENRRQPDPDPQKPGANPICAERIVSRIPVDLTPRRSGALVLRVDPRVWFARVEFDTLEEGDRGSSGIYSIPDAPQGQAAIELFNGIHSVAGYEFVWK